ncbi:MULTISPECIES: BTAD domain-containing putative transcriptional regulator [Actinosynnema]|uniref:AfsR/SARP family transcriptional regulator n=1 Tax=Actinosynnema TaxID=40566 RepID=UPI0020A614D2|nr:BTAD domain-containing putative transcriptional regulator [Actinosynnema pretiosum]MCP2098134.1 DNA-binding transcriptional activator of the SARP family [Actinosynnema pretiosum]
MVVRAGVRAQLGVAIRLFGGPELSGPEVRGVVPLGVKARTLLVVLALEAGVAVSTGRLLDALWEQEPPRSAGKNLQLYASRLRRCLDSVGGGGGSGGGGGLARLLVHVGHGYRLDVRPESVDALRAAERARGGVAALRGGDAAVAEVELGAALAGWPVDGLVGLVPSEPVVAVAGLWRERRLAVVEHLAAAKVELGAWEEAADLLAAQVAANPTRESAHAALMRVLVLRGDRVGAVEVYRRLGRALEAELGVGPGAEAREVFEAALGRG